MSKDGTGKKAKNRARVSVYRKGKDES